MVQAVPGAAVEVSIDGRSVATGAAVGDVVGPFVLSAGGHEVTSPDPVIGSPPRSRSRRGRTDVVLHLPAEVGGDPVVHSYDAPTGAIGPDKARVVLAHTATVAPADVGSTARPSSPTSPTESSPRRRCPAGTHEVALSRPGSTADPILGPLDVALEASTLSMIYAYGNPRDGSMNVIAHTAALTADGTVGPTRIGTGLQGDVRVGVCRPCPLPRERPRPGGKPLSEVSTT